MEELNLNIDENNLLQEWKNQANLMLQYGIQLADAMQEEDEAKTQLSVVAAELDCSIRNEPEKYGLAKITESALMNTIIVQKAHVEATKVLNDARHRARILKAAVDAIGHRKSALQGMTDLFLRQWYADPKSTEQPPELREAAKAGPPTKVIEGRRRRRAEVEQED